MAEVHRIPFGQTTSGVVLIQGVLGPVVGVVVTLLITGGKDIPWAIIAIIAVAVAVVVFLLLSLVLPRLRKLIWGWVPRLFHGLSGLRVTTREGRAALDSAGYDRRSAEVAAERTRAPEPQWNIDARDKFGANADLFWLENSGWEVRDVGLKADPELFAMDGDAFWEGSFGNDRPGAFEGKWFKGVPTERGRAEGVPFTVTWHDRHGDPHSRDITMPSKEMIAGFEEMIEEATAKGRAEGRAVAMDEQRTGIAVPLPQPRWRIAFDSPPVSSNEEDRLLLINSVDRSVAREVRIEVFLGRFQFTSGCHWEDLSGQNAGAFQGFRTDDAEHYGAMFNVTWWDESGQKLIADVRLDATDPLPEDPRQSMRV